MGFPNKNKHNVLLSIVTWNHDKSIKATIDSIFDQTFGNYKVVVFDNNSSDKTIEVLEAIFENTNFTLIQNKENIGFCGGHNYVINNYDYDYIILVNPDVILKEDYIEKTLKAFAINDRIGAVCGLLLQSFDEDPLIDSAGMQLTRSRRFTMINHRAKLNSVKLNSGYVAGLDGALPAFKKEAVDSLMINGEFFNSMFFSHKEDWDVSWRLLLFNWKVYFNKDSVAMHPRFFKPNNIRERIRVSGVIKFHGFKNQFLLFMINDDKTNFLKDSHVIISRMLIASFFCLFFERQSLKAFGYIISNRKQIFSVRRKVQEGRRISTSTFRQYLRRG